MRAGQVGYMDVFPVVNTSGFDMDAYNKRFHEANVIINASARFVYYGDHWGGLSIKCAKGGAEFYRSGDALYRVEDDTFLIFNEGKEYQSWIDSPTEVTSLTLNMSPSFERQALCALRSSAKGLIDDNSFTDRIRFTERLYHHQDGISDLIKTMQFLAQDLPTNHLKLQELYFGLFLNMIRLQQDTSREALATGKMNASARNELFARLVRARDFMYSCYEKDLTLDDIANVACLNPYYFLREFRKAFGTTPHQFLTRRRITQACKLLASGTFTAAEVCLIVGFRDQSSFGKLFKRLTGKTPSSFREAPSEKELA